MGEKLRQSDIQQDGLFDPTVKSAKEVIEVFDKANKELRETAELLATLSKTANTSTQKGINALTTAQKKMNTEFVKAQKIEKLTIKNSKLLQKERLDEIKLQKAREDAIDKFNKKALREKKIMADSKNVLISHNKQLKNARNRYKRLTLELGKNNSKTIQARKNFERLDTKQRELNAATKRGTKALKLFGLSFNTVRGSALRMGAALGVAGGGIAILRGGISTISDFDSVIASLGSITGKTGKGLEDLKGKVLEVSNETGKGATEIAEAMKLVGSSQPELLKNADALAEVTKQSVILAQAGGIDVPVAAAALTKAMNQFGVSAEEAANFTDILATSQQKGTATIEQISESMKNAGSVAKASGLDFQTTNAILQAFAKGGLVGAEAGTKFRAILLKLAKTGREDLNPATQDFNDILNVLKKEVTNVTEAQELFGEESAAAALTLIDQKDVVKELNGNLLDQGNATDQAAQNMNTLAGQSERAVTALKNYILGADGATAISNGLKETLRFLADNLGTIISLLGKVITLAIAYKARLIALNLAQKLFNTESGKMNVSLKTLVSNFKKSAKEGKGFGSALTSIGWAAAIAGATALAKGFFDIATGARQAAFDAVQLEKQLAKGSKQADEIISKRKKERDEALALATSDAERVKIQRNFNKQLRESKDIAIDNLRSEKERVKILKRIVEAAEPLELILESSDAVADMFTDVDDFGDLLGKAQANVAGYQAKVDALGIALKDSSHDQSVLNKELKEGAEITSGSGEAVKGLEKIASLQREITDERLEQIKDAEEREVLQAREAASRRIEDLEGDAEEITTLTRLIEKGLADETSEIRQKFRDEEAEKARADEEAAAAQRTQDRADEEAQLIQSRKDTLDEIKLQLLKSNLEEHEINKEFLEAEIELLQLRTELTLEEEISLEEKKRQLKKLELDEEKEHQDELLKIKQEVFNKLDELGQKALDRQIEESKKKQDLLETEISNSQKLEDRLRESAANQNATAKESLAEQSNITEQKEREKIREAKREAHIEELKALWAALNNFLGQGDSLPVAGGKATAGVLSFKQIFNSLSGFYKGTKGRLGDEHTPMFGGKDGHVVRVDSDEAILTGGKMDRLAAAGLHTTDDIVNSAIMNQQLMGVPMANHIDDRVGAASNAALEKKMDSLISATKANVPYKLDPVFVNGALNGAVQHRVVDGNVERNWNYRGKG